MPPPAGWRLSLLAGAVAAGILSGTTGHATVAAQLAPAPPRGGTSTSTPPAPTIGSLAPAAAAVRGRYLDAVPTVIVGRGATAASRRLTLVVDITPKPGMRVYAPGNPGYTAISLEVDKRPGLTIGQTVYPKPDEYLFVPLNERVKVFTGPFRLARDVRLESPGATSSSGDAAATVLAGKLDYQACDDKVCYLPQTLPITWTWSR